MAQSGTGKQIKRGPEHKRARWINHCMNKAIRDFFVDQTNDVAYAKVQHWQKIVIAFYSKG